MKRTDEDIQFAELLKANTPEPSENPWFTRKVMNRLPYKHSTAHRWVKAIGYAICILLMVISWVAYVTQINLEVVTKGDIYIFIFMVGATAYFTFTALHELITAQDQL
ncbi:MAG: hypothetical protein ACI4AH_00520 [Muribaculaceae bacterium]